MQVHGLLIEAETSFGWRLFDGQHMRMSGYAAQVMLLFWSAGGQRLATSGGHAACAVAILRQGRPDGQAPRLLTPSGHHIEVVARHPRSRPQHQLLTNCCVESVSTLRAAVSQFEFALINATARETIFAHL